MEPADRTSNSLLAAIDLGSNSFRLEIGEALHGRYRRIDYLKETVRLGAGLDADGMLTDEAAERGLACLRRFASRLEGFPPAQVRAVATQTLREARNRNAFLLRGREALGLPIEVISGREEARLIYAGVGWLQPSERGRLVIDIGGRSTELILGRGREVRAAESFAVGSVSLSLRYFPDGRLTARAFREAQVAAGAEFEEALALFAPRAGREALGSSGTVGAVAQILAAEGIGSGSITPQGLQYCIARSIEAGDVEALDLPTLKPDRRAVLPGGLAILYTLAVHFGIAALRPARGALRHGLMAELHEQLEARRREGGVDPRDRSVAALQRRFGVDTRQAARVAAVALHFFDGLQLGLDPEARRELGWASSLHELGLMVSHHDHHRHSAYLLAHVDAPGFSQSLQRRLGDLVLGQRGGLRKLEVPLADVTLAWQVLCLRLAVIACHARADVDLGALTLAADGRRAVLLFAEAWSLEQPRTMHWLHEEAAAWARNGPLRLSLQPVPPR